MNAGVQKGRSPFTVQRVKIGRSYPGTGDLFGSILVGALLEGRPSPPRPTWPPTLWPTPLPPPPKRPTAASACQFEPMLGRLAKR